MAQIPDTVSWLIPPDERQLLAGELQTALAAVDPFTVMIGSCLSYGSGLIFDVFPDDHLGQLLDVVASVVRRVRGPAATAYDIGVPHLTLAYANGAADSDEIQRKLRRVRPSHAPMSIRSVHLVDVASDPDAKTVTWAPPLAEIFLGQNPHAVHPSDTAVQPSRRRPGPRLPTLRREAGSEQTAAPQSSESMSPPSLLGKPLPKGDLPQL
jgi:hypothetical protein